MDQRFRQESQNAWLYKLASFDYMVEYKRGAENRAANALSRREETDTEELIRRKNSSRLEVSLHYNHLVAISQRNGE